MTLRNAGDCSGIATVAGYAVHEFHKAEKLERRPALDPTDAMLKPREAERARADGERFLKPPRNLVGDASTEIVPAPEAGSRLTPVRQHFVDTLAEPNTISIDASEQRALAASRADVLSPALDAAVSARAGNSIERMLCHQLAALHAAGMGLIGRVQNPLEDLPPVEHARLTNAAARCFDAYQAGCLTLQKLKTEGQQHVVVQHVNVGPGGQAVVAGRLSRGSRTGGRAKKSR